MDAKLKSLKVVDLKNILTTAGVSAPAKATKNDLISRIQASKAALDTYATLYPADDLLAPPEEVDWNAEQAGPIAEAPPPSSPPKPKPALAAAPKPASTSAPAPAAATTTSAPATTPAATSTADTDAELEKRRQRAARFGIPLVEPKQPKKPAAAANSAAPVAKARVGADPKKLEERAARFGIKPEQPKTETPAKPNGKKRPAPQAEIDPEEADRRRKRAERFGVSNKV